MRKLFEDIYDRFFDVSNAIELERQNRLLRELCTESKNYVEKTVKCRKVSKLGEEIGFEWSNNIVKTFYNQLMDLLKTGKGVAKERDIGDLKGSEEKEEQFDQWIRQIHFETLKELIIEHREFREELRKGTVVWISEIWFKQFNIK